MRRLLADRRARLYLTGQVASLAGDSCLWLAMGIWVKTLTHSTAAAGLTFFFFTAPTVLAPVAGLLVDRVRRRPLLIVTNAATGISVLALLAVHDRSGVWVIDAVMALYGVSYTLLGSGQSALLTVMLAPELLADANGALRTLQESLRLIGPLAGAGLFVAVGPHLVVAIDAASFAVPVATLLALRVAEPPLAAPTHRLGAELAAGARHVWATAPLRDVVIAAAAATAVFGFAETITYAIAGAGLHRPPAFVGVLVAVQGAGAVVGGPTAAPLLRRIGEPALIAAGMLVAALGALLQTPPVLASVLAGAVVFGAAIPWIVVGLVTFGQRLTPPHLQGRVYAAVDAAITLPQTLSIALGAALVGATGYRPLLLAMAGGMTFAAAVLLVGGRRRAAAARAAPERVSKPRKLRSDTVTARPGEARPRLGSGEGMAKDTEKLIRQLSLISYLMAERRPVTAPEIRRDVEGYSVMNEDAFARRFYADRSELEALGIALAVEKPVDGLVEQENYSLPPENFHLPAIAFTDEELAALRTALQLLDGEFAYAEPLRLALQQISWGRPSPLTTPEQSTVALGITGSAGGHEVSLRLAKIETAIFRRKTIVFDYHTIERDEVGARRVDPYQLLYQGGQFYVVGRAHERSAIRVFRLSRIRGKVGYATKAEHDFQRPEDFDPRAYANRIDWQFGDPVGVAQVLVSERIAWQIERHFGRYGEIRHGADDEPMLFETPYANARQLIAWVLGLGDNARVGGPPELVAELRERVGRLVERHTGEPEIAAELPAATAPPGDPLAPVDAAARRGATDDDDAARGGRDGVTIRPERFARLVTLASILIGAGRGGRVLTEAELRTDLQVSAAELREDIALLNVVNFGAGTYVLYAEILPDGTVEVDPEPYGDSFARPARLLPVEAKALIAAIDLIGEHIPAGSLSSVRTKVVAALGEDPADEGLQFATPGGDDVEIAQVVSRAIAARRLLSFEYYKENEDEFSERTVEPYALINGREGWYLASFDPSRDSIRHFRLDRIKSATVTDERYEPRDDVDPAADVDGWPRTGEVPASRRARVWISPERARWAREERNVVAELADGAVIVELGFAGTDWLVRETLKEAGDAVVLEPAEAREAVRAAAAAIDAAAGHAAPVG